MDRVNGICWSDCTGTHHGQPARIGNRHFVVERRTIRLAVDAAIRQLFRALALIIMSAALGIVPAADSWNGCASRGIRCDI